MIHQGDREPPCASGAEASTPSLILPTDIMLGRGPTSYSNPGNRVFRRMVKEHSVYYKSRTPRKEKAGLVTLVISKLQTMGYRFLHRSSDGDWVEAPLKIAEKKVGHGLRDARLAATKNGGDGTVLPKNFRPAIKKQNHGDQESSLSIRVTKPSQNRSTKKLGKTPVVAVSMCQQCAVHPQELQNSRDYATVASKALASYSSLMQDATTTNSVPLRQMEQKILDANLPMFSSEHPLDLASLVQQHPLADSAQATAGQPLSDFESDGVSGDVNHNEVRSDGLASAAATNDSNLMDAVAMALALNMYRRVDPSLDDLLVDDTLQPPVGSVYDGRSLCDWFSKL